MPANDVMGLDETSLATGGRCPTVEELLGRYAEILNEAGGPESEDAKTFLRKYSDDAEFQSLARTAGFLWDRINKK